MVDDCGLPAMTIPQVLCARRLTRLRGVHLSDLLLEVLRFLETIRSILKCVKLVVKDNKSILNSVFLLVNKIKYNL